MGKNAKFFVSSTETFPDSENKTPIVTTTSSRVSSGNVVHRFGKRIIRQRQNAEASFRSRLLLKHGTYNITGEKLALILILM